MAAGALVPAPALFAVSFPNATSGFGVAGGNEANDGSLPIELATTTDGGTTWHAAGSLLPDANMPLPDGGNVMPQLAFATTSVGYTWDQAQVDATTDGGSHWQVLPDPPGASGGFQVGPATMVGTSLWIAYGPECDSSSCIDRVASWVPAQGWSQRLVGSAAITAMTVASSTVDVLTMMPAAAGQPVSRS